MPTVSEVLAEAKALFTDSTSAKLDAELLLQHVLKKDRIFLYSNNDYQLTHDEIVSMHQLVQKRQAGAPIAHLLGHRDFWTFTLNVTKDTLIPRPETEHLVQAVLDRIPATTAKILELGTGTGAIALALATERPEWQIVATDVSAAALAVAEQNRAQLKLAFDRVSFCQSDWYSALPAELNNKKFAVIVSNPPYVAVGDPNLLQGDVRFETKLALESGSDGLDAIRQIIAGAGQWLIPGGLLAFEHGYDQGKAVRDLLTANNFRDAQTLQDYAGCDRVTLGFIR